MVRHALRVLVFIPQLPEKPLQRRGRQGLDHRLVEEGLCRGVVSILDGV
jgi:hypothetical protein